MNVLGKLKNKCFFAISFNNEKVLLQRKINFQNEYILKGLNIHFNIIIYLQKLKNFFRRFFKKTSTKKKKF